jgi:tetratricopeptide (TPR) repeat protein
MKPSIFFYGNCHAGVSRNAIGRLGAITDNFDLYYVRNDSDPSSWHPEIQSALARCVLLFDQVRSDGAKLRGALNERLPQGARVVRFAPAFLNSIWPFVAEDPRNKRYTGLPEGAYPRALSNYFVLKSLRQGDAPETAAKRFLDSDITKIVDLDRLHEITLTQLKSLEQGSDILLAEFIANNFASQRLFLMPLHPAGGLFAELVRQMIEIIGIATSPAISDLLDDLRSFRGVGAYDAPLHPQVIAHFNLTWASNLSYRHFHEGDFEHDEFVYRHARLEFGLEYYEALRLLDMGLPEKAFPALVSATSSNPRSPYYIRTLGRVANQLRRSGEAVGLLQNAVQKWPENTDLWLELARAAVNLGDMALAEQASEQAVVSGPKLADAWRVRSWALGGANRMSDANSASRQYHLLKSRPPVRPLTEETGAEYGRHWLGYGADGF